MITYFCLFLFDYYSRRYYKNENISSTNLLLVKGLKKGYMEREGFFYYEIDMKRARVINFTLLTGFFSPYLYFSFSSYMCLDCVYGLPNWPETPLVFYIQHFINCRVKSILDFISVKIIFCYISLFHHCLQFLEI